MLKRKILILSIICSLMFTFGSLPVSEAHILIIANADNTTPDSYPIIKATADVLKSKGYKVLELYGENATTKNVIKGMYNADAVIYAGHGGYIFGHYDDNGGIATPPFGLVCSDGFIWGVGDKMREGTNGHLFQAPFKKNIPVILFGACFSSGWVENNEVANPTETIYSFSQMFTGSGANYYATPYERNYQGKQIVDIVAVFLNGANNLGDANQKNFGLTITQSENYNGQTIWHNNHGYNAFVGNWSGKFPKANQTTPYNDSAAEAWYNGALPTPTSELASVASDVANTDVNQLLNDFLDWINYIVNYILNSNSQKNVNFTLN